MQKKIQKSSPNFIRVCVHHDEYRELSQCCRHWDVELIWIIRYVSPNRRRCICFKSTEFESVRFGREWCLKALDIIWDEDRAQNWPNEIFTMHSVKAMLFGCPSRQPIPFEKRIFSFNRNEKCENIISAQIKSDCWFNLNRLAVWIVQSLTN